MSDDHDDHEHVHIPPLFQLFQPPSPEEIERQQMAVEEHAHDVRRFFDSLNSEQLTQLSRVIRASSANESAAAYYAGIVSAMNDIKFKKCLGCSKDHDQMLADVGKDADQTPELKVTEDPNEQVKFNSPRYYELCVEYGVKLAGPAMQVECINCKMMYETLQDRMLRKADKTGCTGCVQKEKWG